MCLGVNMIRILWCLVWTLCARWLPRSVGSSRKCCFLRLFGAQIAPTAVIYSSAKVCFPANLAIKAYSCLASDINCYNVALIKIGANTTISQDDYLCTTSHDISGAFQLSNYRSYHHWKSSMGWSKSLLELERDHWTRSLSRLNSPCIWERETIDSVRRESSKNNKEKNANTIKIRESKSNTHSVVTPFDYRRTE